MKGFKIKHGMETEGFKKNVEEKRYAPTTSGYSGSLRRGSLKDRHRGICRFCRFRFTRAANN